MMPDLAGKQLRWIRLKGKAAGTIFLADIQSISSNEEEEIVKFFPNYTTTLKLSSSEMRFVEAVWRDLGPDGSTWVRCGNGEDVVQDRVFFVNGYIYFVNLTGVLGEPPCVFSRTCEKSLPNMEEKTLARIEELKRRSFAVEEKLRHAEEVKRKPMERRKKPVAKDEQMKASTEEEQDGELYALRCRQGNAAYSAGDWGR